MSWSQKLSVELTLQIHEEKFVIPPSRIEEWNLELHHYGFTGSLQFSLDGKDDLTLFPKFIAPELIQVHWAIGYPPEDQNCEPFQVTGLATDKSVREVYSVDLRHHYRIDIADAAQVLWGQHFPSRLFTNASMKAVVEEYRVESFIPLQYDWPLFERPHPILFLGMGGENRRTSFYDFLLWYIASQNGVWTYRYPQNAYRISGTKEDAAAISLEEKHLDQIDLQEIQIVCPSAPYYSLKILNAHSETPQQEVISQPQTLPQLCKDILVRSPIQQNFDERKQLERNKFKTRQAELNLVFRKFPTFAFASGQLLEFPNELGEYGFLSGKTFRIREVSLSGKRIQDAIHAYELTMTAKLEQRQELFVAYPALPKPEFLEYVEGRIVSKVGGQNEKTLQVFQEKDGLLYLHIAIPLWNDQEVIVPFHPDQMPGSFYCPPRKGDRVLVALEFQSARIQCFLDWHDPLPIQAQGYQISLGTKKDNRTTILNLYKEGKLSFIITTDGTLVTVSKQGGQKSIIEQTPEMIRLEAQQILMEAPEIVIKAKAIDIKKK
jgi:hypothetical protein